MLKCLAGRAREASALTMNIVGKVKVQFEEHLVGQPRQETNTTAAITLFSSQSWRHSGAWPSSAWPSSSTLSIWSPSSMSTSSVQSSLACALSRSTLLKRLQNDWSYMSVCAIRTQHSQPITYSPSNKNLQEMASALTKPSNTSPTLHPPLQTTPPSPWNLAHWHPSSDLES
jgi:hypothetical protein